MISFRYHIFTIVAIFLAVGLGVLMGTSVVQPALIDNLERQVGDLKRDLSDTRAQVGELEAREEEQQRAGDILSLVDGGTLTDVPVVIVTHDGVDGRLLLQARQSLSEAGADLVAVLSATDRMAALDDQARESLGEILGMASGTDPVALRERAADVLAQRLAEVSPRRGSNPGQEDVLDRLLAANFLTTPPGAPGVSPGDLPDIGGQVIVVLSGGPDEPSVPPGDFLVPLVEGLVQLGATVAAGETASNEYPFVPELRSDDSVGDGARMVTVDDLDFSVGGAALVLGLERLLLLGQGGNYGIKPGATGPIPPIT